MRDTTSRRLALLLMLIACSPCAAAQSATDSVRIAFEGYKTALLARDGGAVVDLVDRASIDYYGHAVGLALDADSATVAGLGMIDRLMVLSIRHRVPADTVFSFDGASALRYGVRHGWIDGAGVRQLSVGGVTISGATATAKMLLGRTPAPAAAMTFRREAGSWRFALVSVLAQGERDFQQMAADMGETENGFLAFALEMVSGQPVRPNVWQPLRR